MACAVIFIPLFSSLFVGASIIFDNKSKGNEDNHNL